MEFVAYNPQTGVMISGDRFRAVAVTAVAGVKDLGLSLAE